MTAIWVTIAALAIATTAFKLLGPLLLGGRELPIGASARSSCSPPRCWRRS